MNQARADERYALGVEVDLEWIVGGVFVAVAVVVAGVWAWQRAQDPVTEVEPGLTAKALMDELSPRKKRGAAVSRSEPTPQAPAPTPSGWVGDVAGDDRGAVLGAPPKKDR